QQLTPAGIEGPTARQTQVGAPNPGGEQCLQPLPDGKRNALERRPQQVTATVSQAQPDPGSLRRRIEMRRSLAREVWQEDQPLRTRWDGEGFRVDISPGCRERGAHPLEGEAGILHRR